MNVRRGARTRIVPGSRAAAAGLAVAAALSPAPALAHGASALRPSDLPMQWSLEPQVLIPIAIVAWWYAVGVRAVWRHAGFSRGVRASQAACFACGVVALLVALLSPLDAASDVVFSAHMTQHVLLMLVVAPLVVLGQPGVAFAWALPRDGQRLVHRLQRNRAVCAGASTLTHPYAVWALFAINFWIWHVPALYDAAVRHEALHAIEHGALLGTALLFWWTALRTAGSRRLEYGGAILFVFTTMLQMTIVPALLVFSMDSWYPLYAGIDPAWRLSPLQDQQLAGLLMWMSSNVILLVVTGYLVARWLVADEQRASQEARRFAAARAMRADERELLT